MSLQNEPPKKPTQDQIIQNLLARRAARESLHEFLRQGWSSVEGSKPLVDSWSIGAICEHLEAVYRGEIKNLLINCPPRMSKSTCVSIMYPAWVWTHDASTQFLCTTYALDLSLTLSRKCRQLIESKWYQARWGDRFSIMSDQNAKARFENDRMGYRVATSVDAVTTGIGGDIILADDPNSLKDQSDSMLDTTNAWWSEVMASRLNNFITGRRVIVQQRMHERDLSGYILSSKDEDWTLLRLPMEFEAASRCVTVVLPSTKGNPWHDPRTKDGELLCPERIGPKQLTQIKREMTRGPNGPYTIAGQLQQRPAPQAGGIIKKNWFRLWKQPEPPKLEYTLMSIDTALTANKSSAYSVAMTIGVFRDEHNIPNMILLSLYRSREEYPELRSRIQRLSRDYLDDGDVPRNSKKPKRPDIILIEAKASGITLLQDLKRAGVSAWSYNPDRRGDKVSRVRIISPILADQKFWLPGKPPDYEKHRDWCDPFMAEVLAFPNGATRDIVDTLSQAIDHIASFGYAWHSDDPTPEERPVEIVELGADLFY